MATQGQDAGLVWAAAMGLVNPDDLSQDQLNFLVDQAPQIGVPMAQQSTAYKNTEAVNNQFGSDLSWLDPTFQQTPTLLGQSQASQAYADPAAIQAQYGALSGMGQLANTPMQWMSGDQQQSMYNQLLNVQAPQWDTQAAGRQDQAYGALQNIQAPRFAGSGQQQQVFNQVSNIQGPQWESPDRQTDVYNQARARANGQGAPQFLGDQDQRQVYNALGSIAQSGGGQGITYDPGTRQADQYANLDAIVKGGGADTIEMARRQTQRADQEQWLRSQREADLSDYQSRGLSGSGQELLALGADRQAAAGRNSLADLQTAAALEDRKMQAIGAASGLAGTMRGQTAAEQQFNAARGDNALQNQGTMANALRQGDFQDKSYLDDSMLRALGLSAQEADQLRQSQYAEEMGRTGFELNQSGLQANLANAMRQGTYQEEMGRTGFALDQANGMGNLATAMRGDTYQEQAYQNQAAQNQAIQAANIASQMRSQTYNENMYARENQSQLLNNIGNLSSDIRQNSYAENFGRANAADAFATINNTSINQANQQNTQFLRDQYQNMITTRSQRDQAYLNSGLATADALAQMDARNAVTDTSAWNLGKEKSDAAVAGTFGQAVPQVPGFQNAGDASAMFGKAVAAYATGGGSAAASNGGGSLSNDGQTWSGAEQPNQSGGIGTTSQPLFSPQDPNDPNDPRNKKAYYG